MAPSSVIELSPASAVFVANRVTTLGTWVLAGFGDAILMGVVFCQVGTFFRSQRSKAGLGRHHGWFVMIVTLLSMFKTGQIIAIIWVQNVMEFANPDVARTLVATAWWQVSTPLMTGLVGIVVQTFFALRFYLLAKNAFLVVPIASSMLLGFAAICLQMNSILIGDVPGKIMWLLVHLVCAFLTDLMITVGTCYTLRKRNSGGLASTTSLINRLLRLVFESAIPPTVVATIDLVVSQTVGSKHLLWHLLPNYTLGKLYAIGLLYTVNCINEYRDTQALSHERVSSGSRGKMSKHGDMELGSVRPKGDQVYVKTQIVTHVSPSQGSVEEQPRDVKLSEWQPGWDKN
ncbi:hypothetical protein B0H15DRAFT_238788 [Mycena belliarum]|uniref:DUF6534 domain-containing protein n=1 Tax=Mycena belliarum TaxID=1033014 RepID=A0AAD6XNK4_9AGAR|nr:hypothetical protein B0H15DRAFT_238788 [Mycena belliae]